ncbi:tryptophan-rich sensory protein [Flavobacteriaceae bacterium]|nr:tryptophan-rich sensory protein [Flavobacteriaceae bacterium]
MKEPHQIGIKIYQKHPGLQWDGFFGFAWTFLMTCFAIYLAKLSALVNSSKLISIVLIQYFLNLIWNFIFFNKQEIILGLIDIILLTIVVVFIFIKNISIMNKYSLLILPYILWLLIATSLNLYIAIYN